MLRDGDVCDSMVPNVVTVFWVVTITDKIKNILVGWEISTSF